MPPTRKLRFLQKAKHQIATSSENTHSDQKKQEKSEDSFNDSYFSPSSEDENEPSSESFDPVLANLPTRRVTRGMERKQKERGDNKMVLRQKEKSIFAQMRDISSADIAISESDTAPSEEKKVMETLNEQKLIRREWRDKPEPVHDLHTTPNSNEMQPLDTVSSLLKLVNAVPTHAVQPQTHNGKRNRISQRQDSDNQIISPKSVDRKARALGSPTPSSQPKKSREVRNRDLVRRRGEKTRKEARDDSDDSSNAKDDIQPIRIDTNLTFRDVGGLDNVISLLHEMVVLPLMFPDLFQNRNGGGTHMPRGILLTGPPGTGKTHLVRCLAGVCANMSDFIIPKSGQISTSSDSEVSDSSSYSGKKFRLKRKFNETKRKKEGSISLFMRKGADILSKWVGETERSLRKLFQRASELAPSIIFFDEIDGLAPVRSSRQDQIHSSIVTTLLSLMDGIEDRGNVIVIGATNRPDSVDPALRRPGRFDREIVLPIPSPIARAAILKVHSAGWQMDEKTRTRLMSEVAEKTEGLTGADLKALCDESYLSALRRIHSSLFRFDQLENLIERRKKARRLRRAEEDQEVMGNEVKEREIDPPFPIPDLSRPIIPLISDFMEALSMINPTYQRSHRSFIRPLPTHLLPLRTVAINEIVRPFRSEQPCLHSDAFSWLTLPTQTKRVCLVSGQAGQGQLVFASHLIWSLSSREVFDCSIISLSSPSASHSIHSTSFDSSFNRTEQTTGSMEDAFANKLTQWVVNKANTAQSKSTSLSSTHNTQNSSQTPSILFIPSFETWFSQVSESCHEMLLDAVRDVRSWVGELSTIQVALKSNDTPDKQPSIMNVPSHLVVCTLNCDEDELSEEARMFLNTLGNAAPSLLSSEKLDSGVVSVRLANPTREELTASVVSIVKSSFESVVVHHFLPFLSNCFSEQQRREREQKEKEEQAERERRRQEQNMEAELKKQEAEEETRKQLNLEREQQFLAHLELDQKREQMERDQHNTLNSDPGHNNSSEPLSTSETPPSPPHMPDEQPQPLHNDPSTQTDRKSENKTTVQTKSVKYPLLTSNNLNEIQPATPLNLRSAASAGSKGIDESQADQITPKNTSKHRQSNHLSKTELKRRKDLERGLVQINSPEWSSHDGSSDLFSHTNLSSDSDNSQSQRDETNNEENKDERPSSNEENTSNKPIPETIQTNPLSLEPIPEPQPQSNQRLLTYYPLPPILQTLPHIKPSRQLFNPPSDSQSSLDQSQPHEGRQNTSLPQVSDDRQKQEAGTITQPRKTFHIKQSHTVQPKHEPVSTPNTDQSLSTPSTSQPTPITQPSHSPITIRLKRPLADRRQLQPSRTVIFTQQEHFDVSEDSAVSSSCSSASEFFYHSSTIKQQSYLRELRLLLRQLILKILKNVKFRDFDAALSTLSAVILDQWRIEHGQDTPESQLFPNTHVPTLNQPATLPSPVHSQSAQTKAKKGKQRSGNRRKMRYGSSEYEEPTELSSSTSHYLKTKKASPATPAPSPAPSILTVFPPADPQCLVSMPKDKFHQPFDQQSVLYPHFPQNRKMTSTLISHTSPRPPLPTLTQPLLSPEQALQQSLTLTFIPLSSQLTLIDNNFHETVGTFLLTMYQLRNSIKFIANGEWPDKLVVSNEQTDAVPLISHFKSHPNDECVDCARKLMWRASDLVDICENEVETMNRKAVRKCEVYYLRRLRRKKEHVERKMKRKMKAAEEQKRENEKNTLSSQPLLPQLNLTTLLSSFLTQQSYSLLPACQQFTTAMLRRIESNHTESIEEDGIGVLSFEDCAVLLSRIGSRLEWTEQDTELVMRECVDEDTREMLRDGDDPMVTILAAILRALLSKIGQI
ncbi:putative ATPase histone chaperone YTA7 [Blattamonas nauphoetae]|uniref:ATPase histone chaperone YTA7 n=1 Tax=Blattamonas nauphoetae TaxID=2049346 RepID=A0ABQ9YM88_9EUKA|nr:putative ATPase histone chaperone YTA7 [Blattamonas nauphoetae]